MVAGAIAAETRIGPRRPRADDRERGGEPKRIPARFRR